MAVDKKGNVLKQYPKLVKTGNGKVLCQNEAEEKAALGNVEVKVKEPEKKTGAWDK